MVLLPLIFGLTGCVDYRSFPHFSFSIPELQIESYEIYPG